MAVSMFCVVNVHPQGPGWRQTKITPHRTLEQGGRRRSARKGTKSKSAASTPRIAYTRIRPRQWMDREPSVCAYTGGSVPVAPTVFAPQPHSICPESQDKPGKKEGYAPGAATMESHYPPSSAFARPPTLACSLDNGSSPRRHSEDSLEAAQTLSAYAAAAQGWTSAASNSEGSAFAVGAVRQVPRRRWQPDNEADACSMLACGKLFGYWSGERRHHCRQCGRVVCAACSGRMVRSSPIYPATGWPTCMCMHVLSRNCCEGLAEFQGSHD